MKMYVQSGAAYNGWEPYTDEEIREIYRTARSKTAGQIEILSELRQCRPDEILIILGLEAMPPRRRRGAKA